MFDVFLLKATVIFATLLHIYLVLIFFLLTLSLDVTDDVHHMVKSALDNEDRLGKFSDRYIHVERLKIFSLFQNIDKAVDSTIIVHLY